MRRTGFAARLRKMCGRLVLSVLALALTAPGAVAAQRAINSEPVAPTLTPPARDLAPVESSVFAAPVPLRHNPLGRAVPQRRPVPVDPLVGAQGGPGRTPAPGSTFAGTGNPVACAGCTPPDTTGDVGPNHYVQLVNATKVAIYSKAGLLLSGPFNLGTLWSSGNCIGNAGDPQVLYDEMADRWLLSQFASPTHVCFAISQTADPTGAYFVYEFDVSAFPDYFKVGVWPDAYYMSANETTYTAYAFDRAKMLLGQSATLQKFTGQTNLLMPADVDGSLLPTTAGSSTRSRTASRTAAPMTASSCSDSTRTS